MMKATKGSPVSVVDVTRAVFPPLVAVAISLLLIRSVDQHFEPLALLVLAVPASYLIALGTIWLSPQGRQLFTEALDLIKGGRIQS
jgi:hypothetical protein